MIELQRGAAKAREALRAATEGPQEREEAGGGIPPPSTPTGPTEGHTGATAGIVGPPPVKPGPDMLQVWRDVYRIFSRYAPAIRAAAGTDGENNEEAGRLFTEALQLVIKVAAAGGDAQIIALRVFDMLDDVWRAARGVDNG